MGPVSTPASMRSNVRPTRSRSPAESAQKHPWALRVLGANAGVQHVRPACRHLEDGGFQEGLASRDHEVRTAALEESDRLRRVDGVRLQHGHRRGWTEPRRQRSDRITLELPVAASMHHPVVETQCKHVEQPPHAGTTHLRRDPLQGAIARFVQLDNSGKVTEAGHPGGEAFAVEEGAAMTESVQTGHVDGRLWAR